jgi:mevalonate kinase
MAQASGKVILLGEHAVVYGVSAIAAGLSEGATATASAHATNLLLLGDQQAPPDSDAAKAFSALLAALQVNGVRVQANLQIASGMGLGASAALGVAMARAVLDHVTGASKLAEPPQHDPQRVIEAAMAWERVFHGNPSGIDAAAACFGGCLRFSKAGGVKPLRVKEPLPLAIALTSQAASTKQMVEQVAAQRERKPEVVDKTLNGISSLVENAVLCIEAGDLYGLGKLMDLCQVLLSGLFLSTTEIETACAVAREAGALGAKLTGSGGGGAVVALTQSNQRSRVLDAWRAQGIRCFAADVVASQPGSQAA